VRLNAPRGRSARPYLTTADSAANMQSLGRTRLDAPIRVPPRRLATVVVD
jgi:hypothetical protein